MDAESDLPQMRPRAIRLGESLSTCRLLFHEIIAARPTPRQILSVGKRDAGHSHPPNEWPARQLTLRTSLRLRSAPVTASGDLLQGKVGDSDRARGVPTCGGDSLHLHRARLGQGKRPLINWR